jgi:hypothetical protein
MHCEECKELISVFVDNELPAGPAAEVREHIGICSECAKVCEDLISIIDLCHTGSPSEIIPPNSRALWCRIHNLIESEIKPEPAAEPKKRRWQLTFPQLASAVLAIAVISSLLTVAGIRSYNSMPAEDLASRSSASQTTFEKVFGKLGLMETPQQARARRIKEQQAAIEYWDKRVQLRRVQWDKNMRDAFDRNLNEIDQAVTDYTLILQKDPQDDLSGEMLDSALMEKMNLLREFSEL